MAFAIIDPHGDDSLVSVDMPVFLEANDTATWEASINGGSFSSFGSLGTTVVYTSPSAVTNSDASSNKGADIITIRATDRTIPTPNTDTTTLVLVQGIPAISPTVVSGPNRSAVADVASQPVNRHKNGGPADAPYPAAASLSDESNVNREASTCSSINLDAPFTTAWLTDLTCDCTETCECTSSSSTAFASDDSAGNRIDASVSTPESGGAGVLRMAASFANLKTVAKVSSIKATLFGQLQVKSGCGILPTRGETLDLGVYFSNISDPISGTVAAGRRRRFGWEVRLIEDTAGNVALYWGDKRVEGWKSDGGLNAARGVFGTLTKQGDGSFTRTSKDCVYFDFDSDGRIQRIHDRSSDGNFIYYNYNGSNQVIRIVGPGMGFEPYFTYDGTGRINSMNLEGSVASEERTTYYDYNGSSEMDMVEGPENCLTYFTYTSSNLRTEINPDNFTTTFTYGSETIPRINTIALPENAAIYFAYSDSTPYSTKEQKGCPPQYFDYQWAGNPLSASWQGSIDPTYFTFCPDGKPGMTQGADANVCYYEWDSSGQNTNRYCCEEDTKATYFEYGSCGNLIAKKDSLGRTTYWNYDGNNLQSNWIDADGNTTYFERNSNGKIISMKDRRGHVTEYSWDTRGNHTATKWADGNTRYYDYNDGAEIEVFINEIGATSYYDHDKRGRITKWKDFLGNAAEYAYDNRSNRTIELDRRGHAWYWEYDGLKRNTVQRTALLNTAYFNYDECNLLKNTIDPRGNPTYFYYFDQKRMKAHENALKQITYFEYTSAGQPESRKDARGCTQYFTYDCHHRRNSAKDGAGNVTYLDYDCLGNQDTVIDPRNNITYANYDKLYRVESTRNPLGDQKYFYYDKESNTTTVEDALQQRAYFYYDDRNRQEIVEDAQKNQTYYTYDDLSNQDSIKDARSNVTYSYFDSLSRRFSSRDARNNLTYIEHDSEDNKIASKDARSNTTYFAYNKDNRPSKVKDPLGNETTFSLDAAANLTAVLDARNNPSYFYFDDLNRQFCSEDANQARTYFEFDESGNRDLIKSPLGRITYLDYDCAQRNTKYKDALKGVTTFGYDKASNRHLITDPRSNTAYIDYDALDRIEKQKSPVGGVEVFGYDKLGNQTSTEDPLSRFSYFYFDSLNRVKASENGLQERTYFEYDAVGNTESIKDARLNSRYFTYDSLNRRNSLKDEIGNAWYFDFDAVSNLANEINPRNAVAYWDYDALDRQELQRDSLGRTWYWTYDAVGNGSSLKTGSASVTYYQHDKVNLPDRIDYPDTSHHYFEYNSSQELTAIADPSGRTTFAYDDLSRITTRSNPGSENLYFEYDAAGNRTVLKDPDDFRIYYTYDAANRMTDATSRGYGQQGYGQSPYGGYVSYYEFDLANEIVHETRANKAITYYGYDGTGRQSLIQHRKSTGTLIESYTYTRDENGNIIRNLRGSDSTDVYWNYDAANRITKEAWRTSGGTDIYGFQYDYDGAGNRVFRQNTIKSETTYWEYNLGDETTFQKLGGTTKVTFTFNTNGNLSIEDDVDAGKTYYDYNDLQFLKRVDFPGATATNYFYYNALLERTRKDDSTGGTSYTWDGIVPVVEKDLSDTTTQRMVKGYTPTEGIGAYALQDVSGSIIYSHKNQVGTTQRQTDGSELVVNYYEYDGWSVPLETNQATDQQYRFNGKELDPDSVGSNSENSRYHLPRRAYVSSRGMFVQADPLLRLLARGRQGNRATISQDVLPIYSLLRPVNTVDPLGLDADCLLPNGKTITIKFTLKDCCDDEVKTLKQDLCNAFWLVERADWYSGLARYPEIPNTDWGRNELKKGRKAEKQWFGGGKGLTREQEITVGKLFDKLYDAFTKDGFTIQCVHDDEKDKNCFGNRPMVTPTKDGVPQVIKACKNYFTSGYSRQLKARTIVHEMTHFAGGIRGDVGYIEDADDPKSTYKKGGKEGQSLTTKEKLKNADTYSAFASSFHEFDD